MAAALLFHIISIVIIIQALELEQIARGEEALAVKIQNHSRWLEAVVILTPGVNFVLAYVLFAKGTNTTKRKKYIEAGCKLTEQDKDFH